MENYKEDIGNMMKKSKIVIKEENVICISVSAIVSLLTIILLMRVWEMNLSVPVSTHGGDVALGLSLFKSIADNGWKGFYFNPMIGAPDGSSLVDSPFLDTTLALEVWILSRFLPNANVVFYVDYLLTFPLAAISMNVLMLKLTKCGLSQILISYLFAVTPYHFYRGMNHLTLSHYYVVPIAVYLMLLIYDEEFSTIVPARYLKKGERWKIMFMYAGAIVLGLANVYYAFFGLLCMSIALIAKFFNTKRLTMVVKEATPIYVVFFSALLGLMPKIFFTLFYGKNMMVSKRAPLDSEVYALKIIQLILPCSF